MAIYHMHKFILIDVVASNLYCKLVQRDITTILCRYGITDGVLYISHHAMPERKLPRWMQGSLPRARTCTTNIAPQCDKPWGVEWILGCWSAEVMIEPMLNHYRPSKMLVSLLCLECRNHRCHRLQVPATKLWLRTGGDCTAADALEMTRGQRYLLKFDTRYHAQGFPSVKGFPTAFCTHVRKAQQNQQ